MPTVPAVPAKSPPVITSPLLLANVCFGPLRLMEAVPWLMLASAMRFLAYGNAALAIPTLAVSNFCIFLAFLIAAHRMIEYSQGRSGLGWMSFGEQLALARRVLDRVLLLLAAAFAALHVMGASKLAPHILMGFDGIAFDQFRKMGMVWSSVLAALVSLMVVSAGLNRKVTLLDTLQEFCVRLCELSALGDRRDSDLRAARVLPARRRKRWRSPPLRENSFQIRHWHRTWLAGR